MGRETSEVREEEDGSWANILDIDWGLRKKQAAFPRTTARVWLLMRRCARKEGCPRAVTGPER